MTAEAASSQRDLVCAKGMCINGTYCKQRFDEF
jgi:hypothetical protein